MENAWTNNKKEVAMYYYFTEIGAVIFTPDINITISITNVHIS